MEPDKLTKNAEKILEERYLKKDENGELVESPDDMFKRVAETVAGVNIDYKDYRTVEEEKEEFYNALSELKFIPNSPTLMNAGLDLGQLSACFVLSPNDHMDSIFQQIKNAAKIFQSGGGVGYTFSRLRPKGDRVNTTGGVASGPISFMRVYDEMCNTVKQGGRRRGAQMGILSVHHPDIEMFIEAKDEEGVLENFNISVALSEKFMNAVHNEEQYELRNPRDGEVWDHLDAKRVYNKIVTQAWKNGEPGILFMDKINEENPFDLEEHPEHYMDATNPCGEQCLEDFEACNLGHINLRHVVTDRKVDWDYLEEIVDTAVRFLDNVIDASKFPNVTGYDGEEDAIQKKVEQNRKIGLGVMGWHNMLMKLGIPYDSEEALDKAREVMSFIQEKSKEVSRHIAEERGKFPNWDESIYEKPMRNATTTTIAPTGTTSMIANASGGIEPIFAVSYIKNVLDDESLVMPDPVFEEIAKEQGFYSEELMKKIAKKGSVTDIDEVPEDIKPLFKTALEISPEWHIKMQAAFQEHVDNAISKTVNFPHDATKEDVKDVYDLAYEHDCKGVTVYRSGSRQDQVMEVDSEEDEESEEEVEVEKDDETGEPSLVPRDRPDVMRGATQKIETGYGKLYVTTNEDEHGLFEVFAQIGKAGGFTQSFTESLARMISLCLRAGISADEVIDQLEGIRSPRTKLGSGGKTYSIPDAMAKAIRNYRDELSFNNFEKDSADSSSKTTTEKIVSMGANPACPECGEMMTLTEGCVTCKSCGFSEC